MNGGTLSGVVGAFLCGLLLTVNAFALGWNSTDFIIADQGSRRIAVFDQNLVFRHYLDTTIGQVWGLTFLPNGNLVAVARANPVTGLGRIRIYDSAGNILTNFTDSNIGNPVDIKSDYVSRLFVPQDAPTGIAKYTTAGMYNGTFGTSNFYSAAYLPGDVLWAGNSTGTVTVFDATSGVQTGTVTLDNGQTRTDTMYYSLPTGTVLMTGSPGYNRVYERTTSGTFVREFVVPAGDYVNTGVTRGPGGDVFATRGYGPPLTVHRWTANGNYVGGTNIAANVSSAGNIVWAGSNVVTAAGVNVTGRVVSAAGRGIINASVIFTAPSGEVYSARTNTFGYFRLSDVPAGVTYIADVKHKSYRFAAQTVSLTDELSGLVFTPETENPQPGIWVPNRSHTRAPLDQ